jgi:hypothetical protein
MIKTLIVASFLAYGMPYAGSAMAADCCVNCYPGTGFHLRKGEVHCASQKIEPARPADKKAPIIEKTARYCPSQNGEYALCLYDDEGGREYWLLTNDPRLDEILREWLHIPKKAD